MAKRLFQLDLSKVEVSTEMIKREELDNVVLPEEDKPEDTVYSELKEDGVDIEKDTAALEDISNQLDTAIQVQSDLTDQLEANKTIENPTTENVAGSEVAIESALVKLGVSREEYGLHNRSYKSFSVSQEGIKELLSKIINFFKEMFKKVALFFKELKVKLQLKLGRYESKVSELKFMMEGGIRSGELEKDNIRTSMADDLSEMKLGAVFLYITLLGKAPVVKGSIEDIINRVRDTALRTGDEIHQLLTRAMNSETSLGKDMQIQLIKTAYENFEKNLNKPDDIDRAILDVRAKLGGSLSSEYFDFITLGSTGHEITTLGIRKYGKNDKGEQLVPIIEIVNVDSRQDFIKDELRRKMTNYDNAKRLAQSYIDSAPYVTKSITNAHKIFSAIDKLQNTLNKGLVVLERDAKAREKRTGVFGDLESKDYAETSQKYIQAYVASVKQIAVNVPGAITKVYFSTILDYLITGNKILRYLSGVSNGK